MPIITRTFVANINISYPSADGTSTASLAWAAIQEIKRPIKNSFPNMSSEMSANSAELHSLIGMGGKTVLNEVSQVSQSLLDTKLASDGTAVAATHWGSSEKFIQSATPASPSEEDIWFQI